MKKAKTVMSTLAIIFAAVAAIMLVALPVIDLLGAVAIKAKFDLGAAFSSHIDAIIARAKGLFDFGALFPSCIPFVAIVVGAGIMFVLFVVAFIVLIAKKHAKGLGLIIPVFILGLIGLVAAGIAIVPDSYIVTEATKGAHALVTVAELKYVGYVIVALGGLAGLFAILSFVFYMVYAAKLSKAVAEEEKPAEEAIEQKAPEAVVAEKAVEEVAVAAVAPETKVTPVEESSEVKVVRRILVHRSGKVVRVLNEHYYDVTTNIYVEPGYVDPSMPLETEQQHYEKIIKASAQEAAPAPAPVVVEKKAEVVAPAPAPVVAPAPAPAVKVERIPFAVRMKQADKGLKQAYNEIKSELLSYGIKSRISSTGDTFRLHTKTYAKIVIAGKSLKIYFALDPKAYKDSTFPIGDASNKVAHLETPLVFKVKSDLSVRRAKVLIADAAAKDKLVQGEVVKHDHAKEVK